MQLHWHRRDLRAADNRALADAAADGPVVPVFVFDPEVLESGSPERVQFMRSALSALREWYRDHGSDLVIARGDPREVIPALAGAFDADRVVWNRDYSGLARRRDDAVGDALDSREVDHGSFHDAILHRPGSITTNDGKPYQVYTYFWKKWCDRDKDGPFDAPDADALAEVAGEEGPIDDVLADLPTLADLGFDEPEAEIPSAGTDAARDRLDAFCEGAILRYDEDRDYPAHEATSRLSTDLKWGTIGIREVYAKTVEVRSEVTGAEDEAVETFQQQLAWREFYAHVLRFNPRVVTENYKEYEHPIDWRDDDEELRAWKEGETGYPIVDAGMRQLRAEGWMHNRVRMIVASFLTKDLLLDWREGYAHFRAYLVDHDTANDNGGWQWAASTGTDAQPYFRIFNPTSQGERYDPDGEYIREYVPELDGVDADTIHSWPDLTADERDAAAPDYPAPIVDHGERREQALSMFETARGDD